MRTSTQPLLSIRDAVKWYGRTEALRGVNLDLYPGELLGFLGPNGAGKTTLIRCVSGRSRLDAGRLDFHGCRRGAAVLGVVPQSLAIYFDLTAEQNLMAFGQLHGVPRRELHKRVDAALRWSNLIDRRRDLVRTFSGGMQRRLNIACSLLHFPRIVLLDEPTVGVDPQSRERIYEMLDALRRRGTAILLTTHQLEEAQHRCDRIAIVDQGRVVKVGSFEELVAATIGASQRLTIRFHKAVESRPALLEWDAAGTTGSCTMSDVAVELPPLMRQLHADAESIQQITLQGPTLQHVFLHLTGKELRE